MLSDQHAPIRGSLYIRDRDELVLILDLVYRTGKQIRNQRVVVTTEKKERGNFFKIKIKFNPVLFF